jgi:ubiquinone/menaquinone biosynthesis C-methylase UbiE
MNDDKVEAIIIAKEYEYDYWDGDRRYGYGGYKYIEDRWTPVAKSLIDTYNLNNSSKILDVGCGKAFLLYEIQKLLPGIELHGFDISNHGLAGAKDTLKENLFIHKAQDKYPFDENYFDLVISLACLHNLKINELETALNEIERVGKKKYIMVESYRNEKELFNLECWALTVESLFEHDEWIWIFDKFGFTGNYEFIYFE